MSSDLPGTLTVETRPASTSTATVGKPATTSCSFVSRSGSPGTGRGDALDRTRDGARPAYEPEAGGEPQERDASGTRFGMCRT